MQAEISPAIRQRLVEAARRVAIRAFNNDEDPERDRVLVLVAAEFAVDGARIASVPELPEPHAEQAWATYLEVREHLIAAPKSESGNG